jgi:iron complex transport system ATP-binding protein
VIELADIEFAYDGATILRGLSLRVEPGEVVGVLGPNGSGKSTLLRIALGLLSPRRGTVRLGDVALAGLARRDVAQRVAALLQDESSAFPMSVKDCVLLGRYAHLPPHGFEAAADLRAAEAAMAEVGVLPLAERTLTTLSGGERRRVMLARAFAQCAPALVLDEPAASLDLCHQLELFDRLRARADAGSAVLVSVHDLNLAARACGRVVVIESPDKFSIGSPSEVLDVERVRRVFRVEVERGQTSDGTPFFVALRPS